MATKKKTQRKKKTSITEIIEPWLELDLTAAAKANELEPAFEVDDLVQLVGGLLDAGRHPVLVGEHGVGKTAIVHEVVRRAYAGNGALALRGTRILQISIQRRASSLRRPYLVCEEMQKLVAALRTTRRKMALFIRDLSLAYDYDLEPQLAALAYAFRGPLLGEGTEADMTSLFESGQDLQQHFVTVRVNEPSVDKCRVLLRGWAQKRRESKGQTFSTNAIEQALSLSRRFMASGRLPRKAIEILDQSASLAADRGSITQEDVFDRFCTITQTPRVLVDPAVPLHVDRMKSEFTDRVVGQDHAVDVIMRMVSIIKAGLSDERRPLGVFLWPGPTGVGKTYVAQLLCERLFGHQDRMVRLNMADYKDSSDSDALFGLSTEHESELRQGVFARRLMTMPFGLVLLDEFEKAHHSVHERFLQLFDEGTFINGDGETISCRSWILVATSNAGWESSPGARLGFTSERMANRRTSAEGVLERYFRPELLNRFDRVVHFLPLAENDMRSIAVREIARLSDRTGVEQRRLALRTDPAVIDWIMARGYNPDCGARFLRRAIECHVTSALADLLVRKTFPPGTTITLVVENDQIVARAMGEDETWYVPSQEKCVSQRVAGLEVLDASLRH